MPITDTPAPTGRSRKRGEGAGLVFEGWRWRGNGAVDLRFVFEGKGVIRYRFAIDGMCQEDLERPGVAACLTGVGLSVLPWLWQATRPSEVECRAGNLTEDQLTFWRESYRHALGEWLWENAGRGGVPQPAAGGQSPAVADPSGLLSLRCGEAKAKRRRKDEKGPKEEKEEARSAPVAGEEGRSRESRPRRVLLPLGGGKDSLTLYERLKGVVPQSDFFFLQNQAGEWKRQWRYSAAAEAASPGGVVHLGEARILDDAKWEDMRKGDHKCAGFLWASLVGFASALVALLRGYDCIVVGNERSANGGNGVFMGGGGELNHQYDKSVRFERAMQRYLQEHVRSDLGYFSGLMDLWEVQIAQRFCAHPKYLPVFYSCNEGEGEWCNRCPKCCFVYLLMRAFAPTEAVTDLERRRPSGAPGSPPFAGDLLDDPSLFSVFSSLVAWPPSDRGVKPMDCVGTPEEARLALHLVREKYGETLPQYLREFPGPADEGSKLCSLLTDRGEETHFPKWFQEAIIEPTD
eukprot:Hpha_TRINITY_DN15927_c2_g1::TRINITY_DN15927_c2_g1_i1::g.74219::m.74219